MIPFKLLPIIVLLSSIPASPDAGPEPVPVHNLHTYWYNQEAEITSYSLEQARYGEIHKGTASMVFVTEHFSAEKGTKADRPTSKDVSVLKLNFTKKFNTGIYPYSMMTSTFFPFEKGKHSLKVTSSSQEWCGHSFMDLRNKNKFEVQIASYFEGESQDKVILDKAMLEDDLWSMIRLNPASLPTGDLKVIPSFFYLRLRHRDLKAYSCNAVHIEADHVNTYTLTYPELNRTLMIQYEAVFPFGIIGWEESYSSGFGTGKKQLTTTAKRIKTIKSDYWNKNGVRDSVMRKDLGLD